MNRWISPAALLATLAAGIAAPGVGVAAGAAELPLPGAKERWIRVDAPNVTVYSNDDEATARRVAQSFAALRAVVGRVTAMDVKSTKPVAIYVFAGERSFRPYREAAFGPGQEVAGFFSSTRDASLIALQSGARSDPYRAIYHETMHDVIAANYGAVPTWFDEGLAELYSTFQLDGNKAIVGRTVADHLDWLRDAAWMPLPALLAVDESSREYNESQRAGIFYAQSWALVHHLMLGPPERRAALVRFLDLLRAGKPRDDAFREAFATTYDLMMRDIRQHLARPPFIEFTLAELQLEGDARVTPLAREDALAALGELVAPTAGGATFARAHFDAALALRPGHAGAELGHGLLLEGQGNLDEAVARYRQAAAAEPANELAQFRLGQLLVRLPAPGAGGPPPAHVLEGREALSRALAAAPTRAAAHVALGTSYLRTAEDPAPGVAALETALRLGAGNEAVYGLAVLYLRQGKRAEAERLIDVLARSADPELLKHARQALVLDDLRQADELIAGGKAEEGETLARAALERLEDPRMRAEVEAQLNARRELAAANRWIAEYNRAVALANGGQLAEARAVLVEVAAGTSDATLVQTAHALMAKIDQAMKGQQR